ncbi:MAG: SPOR domain-containing protein [Bacteroidota bacterium]|nr:SPOR domain-containing protein [Bacteroidota bacterium]
MNHFLKKVVILFVLVSSVSLFAQDDNLGEKHKKPFHPKFTLGSGIYTLTGDIQNEEAGLLKGKAGFNAGMKFDLANDLDLSFLLIKTSFSANADEQFSSDVDGFGLHLGYTVNQFFKQSKISPVFSLGIQKLGVSTTILNEKLERASAITIPLGFGMRMKMTKRLQFDIAMNFGMGTGDIDMSKENEDNADGYKSLNFAIHYDLFTPDENAKDDYFDDSYYADVDFAKLEAEDEDGDLVRDMDDYCPKTPIGVRVDKNGCPLDDDKDGIANYLDQQKNTPEGSIVDENGVRLTADKYQSMYSDFEVASRKYANFYNEVEIKRENYKTVDEYLIAKANAFNKAFNESLNDDSKVTGLIYKVKIAEFKDGIPAKMANKLLSLDDLESFTMDDDFVWYAVGSYSTLEGAMSRRDGSSLELQGFDDTYIIVDNNGEISYYVEPTLEVEIEDEEVVVASDKEVDTNDIDESIVKEVDEPINETTYRIQIGAFNKPLSDEVFVGVNNVISFIGKDGLVRYMAGSFIEYKDAIDYQYQMKARGFDDAFIVTYKNGERISLNVAIKTKNTNLVVKEKGSNEVAIDLKFTVQIMVTEALVSADDLKKMSTLDNFDKKAKGSDMYEYYAGTYSSLEEANIQLEKAKLAGFSDTFVFATKNGERITLEQAKEYLKQ